MKRSAIIAALLISAISLFAQEVSLPRPKAKAGMDLLGAIQDRRVSRAFVKKALPLADLSTLLWAGLGTRGADAISLRLACLVQYTLTPAAAITAASLGKDEVPLFIMQVGYTE